MDEIVASNPPAADLKRVVKIGNKVMKLFPKTKIRGKKIEPAMIRMDFGCCLNNSLNGKDYFHNEIENYFKLFCSTFKIWCCSRIFWTIC